MNVIMHKSMPSNKIPKSICSYLGYAQGYNSVLGFCFFFFPQTVIYACREQNDSVKLDIILVLQLVNKFKEYQCIISSVLPFQIS